MSYSLFQCFSKVRIDGQKRPKSTIKEMINSSKEGDDISKLNEEKAKLKESGNEGYTQSEYKTL